MKKLLLLIISLISLSLCAMQMPTLAVMDFEIHPNAMSLGEGFPEQIWRDQEDLFSRDIERILKKSRKFQIVDRSTVHLPKQEKDLIQSQNPDSQELQKLGKLLAAQYLVLGSVESVEARIETRQVPGSARYTYTHAIGSIRFHLRVIDTRDGRVVATQAVSSESETNDTLASKFLEQMKQQAVTQAVNHIIFSLYPMRIARVDKDEIFIDCGEDRGLKVGASLQILEEIEDIIDSNTGEILGRRTKTICRGQITEINQGFSVVKVDRNCSGLKIGMVCKLE